MGKQRPKPAIENPNPSNKIKYYFLKKDFERIMTDNEPNLLGVSFDPITNGDKVDIGVHSFHKNDIHQRIDKSIVLFKAKNVTQFSKDKVEGFDFAFLDKVQLRWLYSMMDDNDRLCLADSWIDLGKTEPFTLDLNRGEKYLTFKVWIENNPSSSFISKPDSKGNFPSFTILPPCPPVWPDILHYYPGTTGWILV